MARASSTPPHLHAALALWDYAARSAAWALRTTVAGPVAEQIHDALSATPEGLTRTELRDLFGRNLPGGRIEAALASLGAAGRAQRHRAATAGRPAEVWTARSRGSAITEPGSRPSRRDRSAAEGLDAGGPDLVTHLIMDIARRLCWRA